MINSYNHNLNKINNNLSNQNNSYAIDMSSNNLDKSKSKRKKIFNTNNSTNINWLLYSSILCI